MTEIKVAVGEDIKLSCVIKGIDVSDKLNLLISEYIKSHFKCLELDIELIKKTSNSGMQTQMKEGIIGMTLLAMSLAESKAVEVKKQLISAIPP